MEDLLDLPQKLQKLASRSTRVREAPQTAASLRVFGIVELLEKILLDVDLGTLLQAQRTNRLFQRVILSTRSLRQKLWFEPPQLADSTQRVAINPMIEAHFQNVGIESIDVDIPVDTCNDAPLISTTFEHRSQLAVLGPGSWREMILIDVACVAGSESMFIWHQTVPGNRHSERIAGIVKNISHVRLGDCVDALLSMRIRAEGFDFEDHLAGLRARRESVVRGRLPRE